MARKRRDASNHPIDIETRRRRQNDTSETEAPARVIDLARQMQFDDIMETIIMRVKQRVQQSQQDAG